MHNELEQEIQMALMRDVNLSPEDYRAKNEEADESTKTHGVKGRAALTESVRHKRIQMNFYGTVLNVLVSLLAEVSEMNRLLRICIDPSWKQEDGHGKQ